MAMSASAARRVTRDARSRPVPDLAANDLGPLAAPIGGIGGHPPAARRSQRGESTDQFGEARKREARRVSAVAGRDEAM